MPPRQRVTASEEPPHTFRIIGFRWPQAQQAGQAKTEYEFPPNSLVTRSQNTTLLFSLYVRVYCSLVSPVSHTLSTD